jgi:DNA-binding NtrC family response regulator
MVGLVGQASGGTLFLDEVLSLSAEAQAKLLRVLETGQFRPLGASDNVKSEFRLVTAAQETIISELEAGHFREDLYHRIAGAVIHLPPLCNRPGDAVVLARHFAAGHGRSLGRGAARLLERYPWPGNVRELRMVIDRAVLATEREQLDAGCLADALSQGRLRSPAPASGPRGTNADAPLRAVCVANAWDPTRIADALGVSRATLYRRLRQEGLSLRRSGNSHEVSKSHQVSKSQAG